MRIERELDISLGYFYRGCLKGNVPAVRTSSSVSFRVIHARRRYCGIRSRADRACAYVPSTVRTHVPVVYEKLVHLTTSYATLSSETWLWKFAHADPRRQKGWPCPSTASTWTGSWAIICVRDGKPLTKITRINHYSEREGVISCFRDGQFCAVVQHRQHNVSRRS